MKVLPLALTAMFVALAPAASAKSKPPPQAPVAPAASKTNLDKLKAQPDSKQAVHKYQSSEFREAADDFKERLKDLMRAQQAAFEEVQAETGGRAGPLERIQVVEQAVLLAAAGLRRLGWDGKIRQYIPADVSIPAIGQGALGIEIRSDDERTREALAFLDDRETSLAVRAERGFLKRLEGGCQVPIAAHGTVAGDTVALSGLIGKPDGSRILRGSRSGSVSDPEAVGVALAGELLSRGGREILDEVYRQSGS